MQSHSVDYASPQGLFLILPLIVLKSRPTLAIIPPSHPESAKTASRPGMRLTTSTDATSDAG